MASRRNLKKNITSIISELITECFVRIDCIPGTDKSAAEDIIAELIEIDADFICRISHTEPGEAKKYYRSLCSAFNEKIDAVVSRIEALGAK